MHTVALGYPAESPSEMQKAAYRSFFVSLGSVLPCETCARGYSGMLAGGALAALDRALDAGSDALFAWTVDVHNSVGLKSPKASSSAEGPPGRWSVERARRAILGDDGQGTGALPRPPGARDDDEAPRGSTVGGDRLVMYPLLMLSAALCIGFVVAIAFLQAAAALWRSGSWAWKAASLRFSL